MKTLKDGWYGDFFIIIYCMSVLSPHSYRVYQLYDYITTHKLTMYTQKLLFSCSASRCCRMLLSFEISWKGLIVYLGKVVIIRHMHKWSVHYLEGYNSDWFLENYPTTTDTEQQALGTTLRL